MVYCFSVNYSYCYYYSQSKADAEKEAGVTFDKYLLVRHRHKVISGVIYLMDVMNLCIEIACRHVD